MESVKKNLVAMIFILIAPWIAEGNTIHYSSNFDLSIPDNSQMPDAVINIDQHHTILDLDVRINIIHTNIFDLQIFLEGPGGDRVSLNMYDFEKDFFVGQNYIDTTFDDQAAIDIADGVAPFTGMFRPKGDISTFNGNDCFGAWKLQIYDTYYNDTGYLENFEITITNPEPTTVVSLGIGGLMLFRKRHR